MALIFKEAYAFNGDISTWDTSKVHTLKEAFSNAHAFNQPIGQWDISRVEDLRLAFFTAKAFNQDLSDWRLESATDLESAFRQCEVFRQNLCDWGQWLPQTANLFRTFERTACPLADELTELAAETPGPFCYTC